MTVAAVPFAGAPYAGAAGVPAVPAAPAAGVTVELQLVHGVWTDVTTFVDFAAGVTVTLPSSLEQIQPATAELTFFNGDGQATPDNATSPWWPGFVEGCPLRVTATLFGMSSVRHVGLVNGIDPDAPGGDTPLSRCRVSSADAMASMQARTLFADWAEYALLLTRGGPKTTDAWLLDPAAGGGSAVVVPGLDAAGPAAVVVPARTGAGQATLNVPDNLSAEGSIRFEASAAVGPVLHTPARAGSLGHVGFACRTEQLPAAGFPQTVATFYSGAAVTGGGDATRIAFTIAWVNNATFCDLNVYDAAGVFVTTLFQRCQDNAWRRVLIWNGGLGGAVQFWPLSTSTTNTYTYRGTIPTVRIDSLVGAVWGGRMELALPGKQTQCVTGEVAAIHFVGSTTVGPLPYLNPALVETGNQRKFDIELYVQPLFAGVQSLGTTDRSLAVKSTAGRSGLDAYAEVARTLGGTTYASVAGGSSVLTFVHPSAMRQSTVWVSVDAETDADARSGVPWSRGTTSRPTRVTATWPGGSVTAVDQAAETVGSVAGSRRAEESVDTTADGLAGALDVASARLTRSSRLRPVQVSLDLTTGKNAAALWPFVAVAVPGVHRWRLSNLPPAMFGVTRLDLHPTGWVETYGVGTAAWTLTDPALADAPPEGAFDDNTYGRFSAGESMNVTGGTAVGTTANGTLIIATAAGFPTLSTTAADYPLDLDWNAETVTIGSAPAGSASPQTVTTTARGVAGTTARIHPAGELIDVALAASFTF